MSNRGYWAPGNYIEIEMPSKQYSYAVVTKTKLLSIMDYCEEEQLGEESISKLDILFTISAKDYTIGKKGWPLTGSLRDNKKFSLKPKFYIEDIITGEYSIVDHHFENRVKATKEECLGLEQAASWPPHSIEQRLKDYYGAKNT
jgi:hypothetical protein